MKQKKHLAIVAVSYTHLKGKVSIDVQGYLREVRDEKVYAIDWKDKLDVLKNTCLLYTSLLMRVACALRLLDASSVS